MTMRGKIDAKGNLWIERAGVMQKMFCAVDAAGRYPCCDFCALFGEPEKDVSKPGTWDLLLCETMLQFEPNGFTDERKDATHAPADHD
jgi:hypothetical protein